MVTDGSPVYRQTSTSADAKAQAGTATWTDYAVQARVKPIAFNGTGRYVAVLGRAQSMTNYYYLALTNTGQVELGKRVGGGADHARHAPPSASPGTWYTLRLEAFGSTLRGFVNGTLVVTRDRHHVRLRPGRAGHVLRQRLVRRRAWSTDGGPTGPTAPTSPTGRPAAAARAPATCRRPAGRLRLGQRAGARTAPPAAPAARPSRSTPRPSSSPRSPPAGPLNICVRGMITLPGPMHDVTRTRRSSASAPAPGITGGGLNIGLPVDDAITTPPANAVHNVIIRNLVFRNATDDSINVQMFSPPRLDRPQRPGAAASTA